jgi:type II secretory pathway pseudopilin PulG
MKAVNRYLKNLRKAMKKGFTLIELAIVGLFLGLLAVFAISQFSGAATDNTRAVSLYEASTKLSDNWSILTQQCGVASDIDAVPMTAGSTATTGNAAKNVSLLLGNLAVNDTAPNTFKTCYDAAGIRPLTGLASGAAGSEKVSSYAVTAAATADKRFLAVTFTGVPASVFNAAALKYAGVTTAPAAATTVAIGSNVAFAFTAETAGLRNVTFVRPL